MQKTVEILLVVGILANIIKAGDLLLRPHQQSWLQEKFDVLTLKLDYTRLLEWFSRILVRRVLLFVARKICIICILLSLSLQKGVPLILRILIMAPVIWLIYDLYFNIKSPHFVNILASKMSVPYRRSKYTWMLSSGGALERSAIQWILDCTSLTYYIFRLIVIATTVLIFTWLTVNGILRIDRLLKPYLMDEVLAWTMVYVYYGAFILLLTHGLSIILLGTSCLIALTVSLAILFMELMLKATRGIVWRITEYSKGAFAAIILLFTALLAVAEAYLKYRK